MHQLSKVHFNTLNPDGSGGSPNRISSLALFLSCEWSRDICIIRERSEKINCLALFLVKQEKEPECLSGSVPISLRSQSKRSLDCARDDKGEGAYGFEHYRTA